MKQCFTVALQIAPDKFQVSSTVFTVLTMKRSCLSNVPFNSYIFSSTPKSFICTISARRPSTSTSFYLYNTYNMNWISPQNRQNSKQFKGLKKKPLVLWRTFWEALGFVAVGVFFVVWVWFFYGCLLFCLLACPFLFLKIMIPIFSSSHGITYCTRQGSEQES